MNNKQLLYFAQIYAIIYLEDGDHMKLFEQFKISKQLTQETKFVKVYKCVSNDKEYKIIITKKFANRHTIIHCTDDRIVWEQIPALINWGGKMPGKRETLYKFVQDKNSVILFVIKGKPNGITGLDDGVFRCANNFDGNYINVMSFGRFKQL